jgi:hypothetical protein
MRAIFDLAIVARTGLVRFHKGAEIRDACQRAAVAMTRILGFS